MREKFNRAISLPIVRSCNCTPNCCAISSRKSSRCQRTSFLSGGGPCRTHSATVASCSGVNLRGGRPGFGRFSSPRSRRRYSDAPNRAASGGPCRRSGPLRPGCDLPAPRRSRASVALRRRPCSGRCLPQFRRSKLRPRNLNRHRPTPRHHGSESDSVASPQITSESRVRRLYTVFVRESRFLFSLAQAWFASYWDSARPAPSPFFWNGTSCLVSWVQVLGIPA